MHAHILRLAQGGEKPAMTITLSAVIPGSPLARRPGMTAERIIVPEMCASLSVFAGTTSLLWRDWLFSLQRTYLSADLTLRRAGTLRALSAPLLARASAKRSTIWWMMPRCFSGDGDCDEGCWPRRAGGGIFSNENAGMTSPIVGFERASDFPPSPIDQADMATRPVYSSNATGTFSSIACAKGLTLRTSPRNRKIVW